MSHCRKMFTACLGLFLAGTVWTSVLHGADDCRAYGCVEGLPIKVEVYRDTPYFFLDNGRLSCRVSIQREAGDALDLLWGSKNDQRSARVTVNGYTQQVTAGGYDGFQWIRIPLPGDLPGEGYTVSLEPARENGLCICCARRPAVAGRGCRLHRSQEGVAGGV